MRRRDFIALGAAAAWPLAARAQQSIGQAAKTARLGLYPIEGRVARTG